MDAQMDRWPADWRRERGGAVQTGSRSARREPVLEIM